MEESTLVASAIQRARRLALKRFRFDPDREEKAQDAESVAWEFAITAPIEATPCTIARFAVRQVAISRQFRQSTRSIDGPTDPRQAAKPVRKSLGSLKVVAPGDNPADVACFWLTFPDWLKSLSLRNRQVALAMIQGEPGHLIAERFNLSTARVSQLRRELQEDWEVFTA